MILRPIARISLVKAARALEVTALLFLGVVTLQAETISPTLLVECDGYHISESCVTGTIVYFESGAAHTAMVRYTVPEASSVPEPRFVAFIAGTLAAMMWRRRSIQSDDSYNRRFAKQKGPDRSGPIVPFT